MSDISTPVTGASVDAIASTAPNDSTSSESSELAAESNVEPENDPNEDFSTWLKRQKAKESKKLEPDTTKDVSKDDSEPKDDSKDEKSAKKEEVTDKKAQSDEKPEKSEPDSIKVNNKTYSAKEIGDLESQIAELSGTKTQLDTMTGQVQDLIKVLRENPGEVLDKLDVKREIIDEWYAEKYLADQIYTKEQILEKKLAKLEQERSTQEASLQAQRQQEESARREAAAKAQREQLVSDFTTKISEAIEQGGLPKSPKVVQLMAQQLKIALGKNPNATAADVVPAVRQELLETQKEILTKLSPEEAATLLGSDFLTKLRQHDVNNLKQTKFEQKSAQKSAPKSPAPKKPSKPKYTNPLQLLDDI